MLNCRNLAIGITPTSCCYVAMLQWMLGTARLFRDLFRILAIDRNTFGHPSYAAVAVAIHSRFKRVSVTSGEIRRVPRPFRLMVQLHPKKRTAVLLKAVIQHGTPCCNAITEDGHKLSPRAKELGIVRDGACLGKHLRRKRNSPRNRKAHFTNAARCPSRGFANQWYG